MKKLIALTMALAMIFAFAACNHEIETSYTVITEENRVIIYVEATDGATLLDVMKGLRDDELLEFTESGGYITSINGIAGASDYSTFWALYTTDEEHSNIEWGDTEYEDKTLGSASLGAKDLHVKSENYYIWEFTSAYGG